MAVLFGLYGLVVVLMFLGGATLDEAIGWPFLILMFYSAPAVPLIILAKRLAGMIRGRGAAIR